MVEGIKRETYPLGVTTRKLALCTPDENETGPPIHAASSDTLVLSGRSWPGVGWPSASQA